jgi:hypothetical protein
VVSLDRKFESRLSIYVSSGPVTFRFPLVGCNIFHLHKIRLKCKGQAVTMLPKQRHIMLSWKYYSKTPEFQLCIRYDTRPTRINYLAIVKQRQENGKITRRQRKRVFFHIHSMNNYTETMDWG